MTWQCHNFQQPPHTQRIYGDYEFYKFSVRSFMQIASLLNIPDFSNITYLWSYSYICLQMITIKVQIKCNHFLNHSDVNILCLIFHCPSRIYPNISATFLGSLWGKVHESTRNLQNILHFSHFVYFMCFIHLREQSSWIEIKVLAQLNSTEPSN